MDEKVRFPDDMTEIVGSLADNDSIMISNSQDGKKPWWISILKLKTFWATIFSKKDASNLTTISEKDSWRTALDIAFRSNALKTLKSGGDASDIGLTNGFYETDGSTSGLPSGANKEGVLTNLFYQGGDKREQVYQTFQDGRTKTYFRSYLGTDADAFTPWESRDNIDSSLFLNKDGSNFTTNPTEKSAWGDFIASVLNGKELSDIGIAGLDEDMIPSGKQAWWGMNTNSLKEFLIRLSDYSYSQSEELLYTSESLLDLSYNVLKKDNAAPFTPTGDYQPATKKFAEDLLTSGTGGEYSDKGDIDCSTNPNYPAGVKGDTYYVSVIGKIGGASGKTVGDVGDIIRCKGDNAGGDEATVGGSWYVVQGNTEKATQTEAETATDDNKRMTPLKSKQGFISWVVNTTFSGLNTTVKTIQGAINELFSSSHSHDNSAQIEKIGESEGEPTYNSAQLLKGTAVKLINSGTEITDSRSLVLADNGKVFEVNKATDVTLTIPTNADAAFPIGSSMSFIKADDGNVIIAGAVGVTLKSAYDLTTLSVKEDQFGIRKTATDTWRIFGADY